MTTKATHTRRGRLTTKPAGECQQGNAPVPPGFCLTKPAGECPSPTRLGGVVLDRALAVVHLVDRLVRVRGRQLQDRDLDPLLLLPARHVLARLDIQDAATV